MLALPFWLVSRTSGNKGGFSFPGVPGRSRALWILVAFTAGMHSREPLSIFHAYDVRGRWGEEISPSLGRRLGRALASRMNGPILIGRDTRSASRLLQDSITAGLWDVGLPTVDLGILPTPAIGFACRESARFGLAITPSHNPLGYVGVKAFTRAGIPFSTQWVAVSRTLANLPASSVPKPSQPRQGLPRPSKEDWGPKYVGHLTTGRTTTARVVVDTRGGATAQVAPAALQTMGADVLSMRTGFSARFFGGSPEPTPENIQGLIARVLTERAALGVTFDGDGDRVLFVDETGVLIPPEAVAVFLHERLAPKRMPLVATADASMRCEAKTLVVRSQIGSRFVAQAMKRSKARVGFEVSSHYYLSDFAPDSDGVLTACILLDLLSSTRLRASAVRKRFGPVHRLAGSLPFASMSEARRTYGTLRARFQGRSLASPDGFYLPFSGGRVHIRPSNTQPIIRWTVEGTARRSLGRGVAFVHQEFLGLA